MLMHALFQLKVNDMNINYWVMVSFTACSTFFVNIVKPMFFIILLNRNKVETPGFQGFQFSLETGQ